MDFTQVLSRWSLQVVLLFLVYSNLVDSLYFHIQEGERKCFIEEIPDDTLVVGKLFWTHFSFVVTFSIDFILTFCTNWL